MGAGRNSVEPNLKDALISRNRDVDEFFSVKSLLLTEKKKKKSESDSESGSGDEMVSEDGNYSYIEREGVSFFKPLKTSFVTFWF